MGRAFAPTAAPCIIGGMKDVPLHPAAKLQFERIVDEFARWRRLSESERPPPPAWWWGPAFEVRDVAQALPRAWCTSLRLPVGATYAAAADVLLRSLAGQTVPAWPYDFSRVIDSADSDVRDLHVQPSDDSAFPP